MWLRDSRGMEEKRIEMGRVVYDTKHT